MRERRRKKRKQFLRKSWTREDVRPRGVHGQIQKFESGGYIPAWKKRRNIKRDTAVNKKEIRFSHQKRRHANDSGKGGQGWYP